MERCRWDWFNGLTCVVGQVAAALAVEGSVFAGPQGHVGQVIAGRHIEGDVTAGLNVGSVLAGRFFRHGPRFGRWNP